MTALDDRFEIASGLAGAPIAAHELYDHIARLVPRMPWPAPSKHPDGSAEEQASLGGHVLGDARRDRYAMVTRSPASHAALARWVETRSSELVGLPDGITLESWYRTRRDLPRAVCAAGTELPWGDLVAVQQAGACVARLPYDRPEEAAAWCAAAIDRWHYPPRLLRRVWLVAPDNDDFTRRLARYVVPAAADAFRERDIACEPRGCHGDDAVRLVVLLCHGDADGTPIVSPATLAGVLRACASGAIVVHLGCHGAGRVAGDRYGGLAPSRLGIEGNAAHDACAGFARRCLDAGAPAVIAHLDATWSKTFERASLPALIEMLALLADGAATAGYAAGMLAHAGDARAREAVEHLRAGRVTEAGDAWLRYLDLSGFVCLGEVCAQLGSD